VAKKQSDIKLLPLKNYTYKYPGTPKCGCGRPAEYEVYDDHQPHCQSCMLEAVDCQIPVMVRRLEGGFDDAS
jgi:hypothetical protein